MSISSACSSLTTLTLLFLITILLHHDQDQAASLLLIGDTATKRCSRHSVYQFHPLPSPCVTIFGLSSSSSSRHSNLNHDVPNQPKQIIMMKSSTTSLYNAKNINNNIHNLKEPHENESNFGRQKYWNEFYVAKEEFSWYSPWNDIKPFFMELVPLPLSLPSSSSLENGENHNNLIPRVLLPGIGNDSSMVDMFDDGYTHLTAFDYAEEGVECARKFFGSRLLENNNEEGEGRRARRNGVPEKGIECTMNTTAAATTATEGREGNDHCYGVDLRVADARQLPYQSNSFDAILEKGTLDSIYISGGKDKELANEYLNMAVDELTRVISIGGILMSISAACADAIEAVFVQRSDDWEMIRDGGFYITDDGYSSNNIDATIFALKRIK